MKSFKHWHFQEVEDTFGIKRVQELPKLSEWMDVDVSDISMERKEAIEKLRANLLRFVDCWNEQEMSVYFIAPFLSLTDIQQDGYRGFWERPLSVRKGDEIASGIIDFMLAKGRQLPQAPYFFINEYKPETGTANDPIGQLLMGMLAAQQENQAVQYDDLTIYGAYIIGRIWYFVTLDREKYAISDAFPATQDDIFVIYQMLQKVRRYADMVVSA